MKSEGSNVGKERRSLPLRSRVMIERCTTRADARDITASDFKLQS